MVVSLTVKCQRGGSRTYRERLISETVKFTQKKQLQKSQILTFELHEKNGKIIT